MSMIVGINAIAPEMNPVEILRSIMKDEKDLKCPIGKRIGYFKTIDQ